MPAENKQSANKRTAATADKYELYQLAVQSAPEDIEFMVQTYQAMRGKQAQHFREDFCGTCLLSASWVAQGQDYTAEAYDIDPEPLAWGARENLLPLGSVGERVIQFEVDARTPSQVAPDIRCAQNFSYWVFNTRAMMLDYFAGARRDLADDGIFIIDLHGGPDGIRAMEHETQLEDQGFSYLWDQDEIHPITSEATLHIHFRFDDGSEMRDAFTYRWRLWGLTELREILNDAGFSRVDCYWEGTAEDGESGNGIFEINEQGEACDSFVAYLVALK